MDSVTLAFLHLHLPYFTNISFNEIKTSYIGKEFLRFCTKPHKSETTGPASLCGNDRGQSGAKQFLY